MLLFLAFKMANFPRGIDFFKKIAYTIYSDK